MEVRVDWDRRPARIEERGGTKLFLAEILGSPSRLVRGTIVLLLFLSSGFLLSAQTRPGTLTGTVADQVDAVIPNAQLTIRGSRGFSRSATSDGLGRFTFTGLPAGAYTLSVTAEGFADYTNADVRIAAGQTLTRNVSLAITTVQSQIDVAADANEVSVEASSNADALVLTDADLATLSDNPDDLMEDLQALAGPGAGEDGGEILVDGFSGGEPPPKSSIREVRVNQNPFSAEYERPGRGRVEILTKPGTDRFRGNMRFDFGDAVLNSRNPFVDQKPDFRRKSWDGSLGGPLTAKTSFFVNLSREDVAENSVINALILDPSLNVTTFQQTVPNPNDETEFNVRIDHQLGANHTLIGRYELDRESQENSGLGTFSLPTRAYNQEMREHALRLTETAILSPSSVNEVRFQYWRTYSANLAANEDPTIEVQQAFSSGGAAVGLSNSKQNQFELTNILSHNRGQHLMRMGGRVRQVSIADRSMQNFNGRFTFSSLEAYRITQQGLQDGWTPEQIAAAGGGPIQFTMTAGNPLASVSQTDVGVFFQDDWKVHPQFTLSTGLRYENQTNISSLSNFAPRIGVAWAPGGRDRKQPTVIRGGFGIFYNRVGQNLTLQALRLNGVRQQQFVVTSPLFYPNIPSVDQLAGNVLEQAVRVVDPSVGAPYNLQTSISLERQLPKRTTLSLSYVNTQGYRRLRSRNINAPLAGTYDPMQPDSGVRPLEGGNVYSYESTGSFQQNQLVVRVNARPSSRFDVFGFYSLGKASSDTDSAGTFPASPYDISSEFGRAGFDVRHRGTIGGSLRVPGDVSLNPFVTMNSGSPFNIVIGRDVNGDSLFTDRPAFATDLSRPSVMHTAYGVFDTDPIPGQTFIPRNWGEGPGQFMVNMRVSKTFNFGAREPRTTASTQPFQEGGRG
ncbi:MAG: TonB-dependent receptor, partial [Candidatus Korobacteraceae bacterium]